MKADVAIVIVTYNSEGQIRECLESVYHQKSRVNQEIIIVDNDSKDGTVSLIQSEFPGVKLVLPGANLGFAKGVNLGASHADADFILLLNPDTVILENAVDVIVEFARANPAYGLYGGRTLREDGSVDFNSCWGAPTLWSMGLFALGLTTLAPKNRWLDPESMGHWHRDTVKEVGVITGCFLLVETKVWKQLGGLDERYFMYGEDVDFAMRAKDLGYSPVICPDAKLIHEGGQSSETPVHKTLLLYRGKASLVRTHWHGAQQSLGLFLLAAGTGLRAAASGLKKSNTGTDAAGRWQTLWQRRSEWIQGYSQSASTSGSN